MPFWRKFSILMLPLTLGAGAWAAAPATETGGAAPQATTLTLLGTAGGPIIRTYRSQPSSMLTVNGRHFLIDAGEGTVRRLQEAGVQASEIEKVFLTHLHFDHTAGLGSLFAFAWTMPTGKPIEVIGPAGTQAIVADALNANRTSKTLYEAITPGAPDWMKIAVAKPFEADKPTIIYKDGDVTVTAVANSHFDAVPVPDQPYGKVRAYAYRFETKDRVIVFTGDTGPSPAVVKLADGADILVSEIIDLDHAVEVAKAQGRTGRDLEGIVAHHTREHLIPEEVGKLAAAAKVKMVVLNHMAFALDREGAAAPFLAGVRKYYNGPVVAGRDLDQF
ncbi:MBL fold metallo-hydrolase [Sphingobium phenoxybenzoativorans]|uniref:MBL fold metallo-hydrolase n=1 Tax=Sphingobium phenoxybenzoativorans TaxID=1592790 RepID=UPI00087204EC|nr:MBL fold metallo-hydrolase [Sphingobium phenoxybenzoativorans]